MKDTNKTYAIVEVIDGEKIQLVRPSFSHHSPCIECGVGGGCLVLQLFVSVHLVPGNSRG